LSGANSAWAVAAITGNGPDQIGGKQNEEAEGSERDGENAGNGCQGNGRMDEIAPGNSSGKSKAARCRKWLFWQY
jgi:hypothetical protein